MTTKPRRLGDPDLSEEKGLARVLEGAPERPKQLSEELPETQGKKGQKRHRLNVSFTEANMAFLHRITRLRGTTVAAYINRLIAADRIKEEPRLDAIADLLGKDLETILKETGQAE